jgi:hypothetical protein
VSLAKGIFLMVFGVVLAIMPFVESRVGRHQRHNPHWRWGTRLLVAAVGLAVIVLGVYLAGIEHGHDLVDLR